MPEWQFKGTLTLDKFWAYALTWKDVAEKIICGFCGQGAEHIVA